MCVCVCVHGCLCVSMPHRACVGTSAVLCTVRFFRAAFLYISVKCFSSTVHKFVYQTLKLRIHLTADHLKQQRTILVTCKRVFSLEAKSSTPHHHHHDNNWATSINIKNIILCTYTGGVVSLPHSYCCFSTFTSPN